MYYFTLNNHEQKKNYLNASIFAIIATALSASPVTAQDPTDSPIMIEEVVVTAKKREQNLQDVPIAITALSADSLTKTGIKTTEDLSISVPGLNVSRQLSGIAPFLRGVGTASAAPGHEGAVAVYVDEVYQPSAYGSIFSLANVERVEVLRGPQGTLFGRNATGGLIHVVTKNPSQETSGNVSIGYGSQDTVEGQLYATTGLSENIAADISLYVRDQGEGFGTNLATGSDALYRDEYTARTKLLFDYDTTQVVLSADYGKSESDFGLARRVMAGGFTVRGTPAPADFFDVNRAEDAGSENEQWGISARLTQNFDSFDLIAIASHRQVDVAFNMDQGDDSLPFLVAENETYSDSYSAEIRLQSTDDSRLEWTLGAFYFNDEAAWDPFILSGPGFIALSGGASSARALNSIQESDSVAVFGEVVWALDDVTNLTAGYRYTEDDKDFKTVTTVFPVGAPAGVAHPAYTDSASFSEPSWRLTIDRKFMDDDLLVYATVSRGFKSGVFNTNDATSGPVDPELLDSYEIGLKATVADRVRINGAAFFYEYDDLQLQTQIQGQSILANAAEAESKGVELEVAATVNEEIDVNMAVAWTDGEFKDFPGAQLTTPNTAFPAPCPAGPPISKLCVFRQCRRQSIATRA